MITLKKVAKQAENVSNDILNNSADKFLSFDERLIKLQAEYDDCLPLEVELKEKLSDKIEKVKLHQAQLNNTIKFGGFGYQILNPEFLKESSEQRVTAYDSDGDSRSCETPAFAIFTMKDNVCKILLHGSGWTLRKSDHNAIKNMFNKKHKSWYIDSKAECKFTGKIPPESRIKIKTAIKHFGEDNVFIVADAVWKAKNKVDPLVVAHDGVNDFLWLVDAFDLTPLEKNVIENNK